MAFLGLLLAFTGAAFVWSSLANLRLKRELKTLQKYEKATSRLISENETITDEFIFNFLETLLEVAMQSYIVYLAAPKNPLIKESLLKTHRLAGLQAEIVVSRLLGKYKFQPLPPEIPDHFDLKEAVQETVKRFSNTIKIETSPGANYSIALPETIIRYMVHISIAILHKLEPSEKIKVSWQLLANYEIMIESEPKDGEIPEEMSDEWESVQYLAALCKAKIYANFWKKKAQFRIILPEK